MISHAMNILTAAVQEALHAEFPESRPPVRLGRVTEASAQGNTGLVLSLVNVGVDPGQAPRGAAAAPGALPAIRLTVLIAAGPGNGYADSLDLLSAAVRHLHMHPVLTRANCPALSDAFDRISIAPLSLDLERLRGLWSLQGAPYCPSLAYEIRVQPGSTIDTRRKISLVPAERETAPQK